MKLRNLCEKKANAEPARERINYGIDKVSLVNNFDSNVTPCQKENEQTQKRETLEVKKTNRPKTTSHAMKNEPSQVGLSLSPKQFQSSTTRTLKRTRTVPASVSSCSSRSPDVCSPLLLTPPKKKILNIPSAKRQALMGYNLPVINEHNYVSCPAISKCKEAVCVEDKT